MRYTITLLCVGLSMIAHGENREARLRALRNICAFISSDDLSVDFIEPTPDNIIRKYNVTTNDVVEDLKEIVRRSNIAETNFYAQLPRKRAVSFIGRYGGTNDLEYLHTIMTNSADYAQHSAVGASISILQHSPELIDLARGIATNSVVYSTSIRRWTQCALLGMCIEGKSDDYINDPAQHARIAAFFLERAAVERDGDVLFVDRCAYTLNPSYRHSQQRRDNLAAARPPNLTGKPAELYDARQRDALPE